MRYIVTAIGCAALTAVGGDLAAAPPADPLRDALGRLERELETEQQTRARGLGTDWDVDFARADLAEARHDAALVAGDRAEVGKQLRTLVAVWERYWERMAPGAEHGTTSPVEVENARRRLAAARYRLAIFDGRAAAADEQLRRVTAACDRLVDRLGRAYAHRAAALRDLNVARYLAWSARYVRARAGGRPGDIRAEIDRAVAVWEAEAERVGRVHRTGAAAHLEDYQARYYLATVRLRRATIERDRKAAAARLRARIEVTDDTLSGLDPTDRYLGRRRPWFEWQRAFDRLCLDRLDRDGTVPPDTAAADLGW